MSSLGEIAVTGADGWLGRRLVSALLFGLPDCPTLPVACAGVRALTFGNTPLVAAAGLRVVGGDVRDIDSLAPLFDGVPPATVFHCAGIIHPAARTKDFYTVNVEGTRSVLRAAVATGVRRFVHCSSNSPIGCNPSPMQSFDETAGYAPYLHYGRSKKLAEDIVLEAGDKGDIEVVVIRPPWFYGPGQPARQTAFFRMIRDGKFPLLGDGDNARSMAYIDNLCQAFLLAAVAATAAGQIYWIADERPYPMTEIVATVGRVLREDFGIPVREPSTRLPSLIGDIAEGVDRMIQGLGFYHQKVHVLGELNKNIACRVDKAINELGYRPHVALREGMKRSVRWVLDTYGEL